MKTLLLIFAGVEGPATDEGEQRLFPTLTESILCGETDAALLTKQEISNKVRKLALGFFAVGQFAVIKKTEPN